MILPPWLDLPDLYSDRFVLRLDPGSAFGTGSHPTTRLCLEALDRNPPLGMRVADIGCGSGILGLAALLLGAKEVKSVDIDDNKQVVVRTVSKGPSAPELAGANA